MVGGAIYMMFAVFCTAQASKIIELNGVESLVAFEHEEVTIECDAETDVPYCTVVDPSGKHYSFPDTFLEDGRCSYKAIITADDNGLWQCIGREEYSRMNITKIINVQVTSRLTAINQRVRTVPGTEVTLSCKTLDGRPLSYCLFEPPVGKPFSIDSNVTEENAILDRYFFPPNMSLDSGDCAVSIRKVEHEDEGRWSCGVRQDDGKEHLDTITLQLKALKGFHTLPEGTGPALGVLCFVSTFMAVLMLILIRRHIVRTAPVTDESPLPSTIRIPIIIITSPSPTNSRYRY